jgi:hypothetical protein
MHTSATEVKFDWSSSFGFIISLIASALRCITAIKAQHSSLAKTSVTNANHLTQKLTHFTLPLVVIFSCLSSDCEFDHYGWGK